MIKLAEKKQRTGLLGFVIKIGGKFLSIFLKIFKSLKLLKVGLAIVSYASFVVLFNWKFALLLMIAIAWHEYGHVWAMKRMGIKTKGWYAIPLIGAAAIPEEQYKTYSQHAYVSIMGPIFGLVMALVSYVLFVFTHQVLFAICAGWIALLNLLNLFPIVPLDGGQILRTITFSLNNKLGFLFLFASLGTSCYVMFKLKVGLFAFLILVGIIDLVVEIIRRWDIKRKNRFPWSQVIIVPEKMNKSQIVLTALCYVLTCFVLVAIMKNVAHVPGADLALMFVAS